MNQLSNQAAEMGVLGAALLDADKVMPFAVTQKKLLPDAFHHPPHAYLWKTLMIMADEKRPIDVLTVAEKLGQVGLDKIGGTAYLNGLLDSIPTAAHAEYYMDILMEWHTIRKISMLEIELKEAVAQGELSECQRLNGLIQTALTDHAKSDEDRFPSIRYLDLVNYTVPEGHIIAGHGWLRRGGGCLLTGGTSLGKSILAEQIAVSVASGLPILGCLKVPAPARVLYIQAENDEETLQRDILSIVKFLKADTALVQENLSIHHVYGLQGSSLDAWVENQIIKQSIDLFILDPYQNFIPAGMNINDASTFLAFNFNLNRIIKQHNCAFLLVTHTPKPHDREQWTARESVYMAVGSQAIAAWARTSAEITGYQDDDTKYRLRFGKNAERNGLDNGTGGLVRDLMIQHSPSIHEPYWTVPSDQSEPNKSSEMGKKIIMMANEHPSYSYAKIAEEIKCSKSVVGKWYPRKEE
jgi:hypothetical protein